MPCEVRDRLRALRQELELAVLAAFFCLLFFAAAKKSRCRPAQGGRLKHANESRMPAQRPKDQTASPAPRRQPADATAKARKPKSVHATKVQIQLPAHSQKNQAKRAPHTKSIFRCTLNDLSHLSRRYQQACEQKLLITPNPTITDRFTAQQAAPSPSAEDSPSPETTQPYRSISRQ